MTIQRLQEKAILTQAHHFSDELRSAITDTGNARKRYTILKTFVRAIISGVDHLKKTHEPKEYNLLLHSFSEHFLPNQQSIEALIGGDSDNQTLKNSLKKLQYFFTDELSSQPNALELYNSMAMALQVEVVRVSRELKAEDNDPKFIRQGQLIEVETDETTDDEEKRYLEELLYQGGAEVSDAQQQHLASRFAHLIEQLSSQPKDTTEEKPKEKPDHNKPARPDITPEAGKNTGSHERER